ncbi:MAG: hypothetical protein K940chlam8_00178 [Chlamydiae bacterium]|nr:hypothetical protein [Chlamydiota bacterium]
MNELVFTLQILCIVFFLIVCTKIGKGALTGIIVIQMICANLFILKQINLFGMHVTTCDMYAIGAILGMNILQEYYGKQATHKCLLYSFICLFFFAIMSRFHTLYIPNIYDYTHQSYQNIISRMPRIFFASIFVFFITQMLDIKLFGFLKQRFVSLNLTIRILGSIVFIQFLDSAFFSFLGLYGLVHNLRHVILVSFIIKLIVIAFSVPFVPLLQRWIPKEKTTHDLF